MGGEALVGGERGGEGVEPGGGRGRAGGSVFQKLVTLESTLAETFIFLLHEWIRCLVCFFKTKWKFLKCKLGSLWCQVLCLKVSVPNDQLLGRFVLET